MWLKQFGCCDSGIEIILLDFYRKECKIYKMSICTARLQSGCASSQWLAKILFPPMKGGMSLWSLLPVYQNRIELKLASGTRTRSSSRKNGLLWGVLRFPIQHLLSKPINWGLRWKARSSNMFIVGLFLAIYWGFLLSEKIRFFVSHISIRFKPVLLFDWQLKSPRLDTTEKMHI